MGGLTGMLMLPPTQISYPFQNMTLGALTTLISMVLMYLQGFIVNDTMSILQQLWEAKYLSFLFIIMTILSTHLIVKGLLLDKSKGDSMSLVYLNILLAVPLDYFIGN